MGEINNLFDSKSSASESEAPASTPIVGKLVAVDEEGRALVDFRGNTSGPRMAKTTVTLPPSQAEPGQRVLLIFEDDHSGTPIIIGVVGDVLVPSQSQTVTLPVGVPDAATVDGKKVRFDAKEEIQLVCGKSSILLRADGKVVIKGRNILNRALESNKIKGARIGIN